MKWPYTDSESRRSKCRCLAGGGGYRPSSISPVQGNRMLIVSHSGDLNVFCMTPRNGRNQPPILRGLKIVLNRKGRNCFQE
jgi:hypothetical protein